MSAISLDDLERAEFVFDRFIDGARLPDFKLKAHGHAYRCKDLPRLTKTLWYEQTQDDVWTRDLRIHVDGQEVADLGAAVDALNTPPLVTGEQARLLDLVPVDFIDLIPLLNVFADGLDIDRSISWMQRRDRFETVLRTLEDKGLVEIRPLSQLQPANGHSAGGAQEVIRRRIDRPHQIGAGGPSPG